MKLLLRPLACFLAAIPLGAAEPETRLLYVAAPGIRNYLEWGGHGVLVFDIFDATVTPPKQVGSVALRDDPGWVTFSIKGDYAYPSSGDVIDVATHKIVATLEDEEGRHVGSEKLLEIDFADGRPIRTGDQFGLGRVR